MTYLLSLPNATVEAVLSGRQTLLGRWSVSRRSRSLGIHTGDSLLLRRKRGKIIGKVEVRKTILFDHPEAEELAVIKQIWQERLNVPDVFFQDRVKEQFLSLLFLGHPEQFLFPLISSKIPNNPAYSPRRRR